MNLESSLDSLKGIGEKTKQLFAKAGIENLNELITHYPRTYERFEDPVTIEVLADGTTAAVSARLTSTLSSRYIRGLSISTVTCSDGSGELTLTWFNMPYLKNTLRTGVT